MCWLSTVQAVKIKFLDEGHFVPRALYNNRGISPIGEKVFAVRDGTIPKSFSMTIMTSLNTYNPIFSEIRYLSNSSEDFISFLLDTIDSGFLINGDYLVMDNSPVHTSCDAMEMMDIIFDVYGIKVVFLPKYSPEWNPCELVFAHIKRYLREYGKTKNFHWDVLMGVSSIKRDTLLSYYYHCMKLC